MDSVEKILEFPHSFTMKAIGDHSKSFESLVISIMLKHVAYINSCDISCRPSRNGKYISVSATFIAKSQEQLESLYSELNNHERVLMIIC